MGEIRWLFKCIFMGYLRFGKGVHFNDWSRLVINFKTMAESELCEFEVGQT
jgi:hypothetical protein